MREPIQCGVQGECAAATGWSAGRQCQSVVLGRRRVGVSAELGALLRREGLHAAPLTEWRAAAEAALGPPARTARTEDGARIHALEREVRRNDRALAESAALRVLKKTFRRFGGTRTIPRTREAHDDPCDVRNGPPHAPANKLTATERRLVLETVNSPTSRDRSPQQIVPHLADTGRDPASESTIYRVLR